MSWHPGIPEESNLVRSTSGDLLYMKENFDLLSGVATKGVSGISGVLAAGPTVGDTLTWDGTNWIASGLERTLNWLTDVDTAGVVSGQSLVYDGTNWVDATPVAALNDLTDVSTAGAANGNALVFNGSTWEPGSASAVSGTPGNAAALTLTGTFVVSGNNVTRTLAYDQVAFNPESWAVSTVTGSITVPSGVQYIDIHAQTRWPDQTASGSMETVVQLDGAPLSSLAGYGISAVGRANKLAGGDVDGYVTDALALTVPVSGGEVITTSITRPAAGTGNVSLVSSVETFLLVRESAGGGGGGGGGGSGFTDPVKVYMPLAPPSGAHQMNDEFDWEVGDGNGPGGLDSRWNIWEASSGTCKPELISGANKLLLEFTTSSAAWSGVYQTISGVGSPVSGSNFTIYAQVSWTMRQTASDQMTFFFGMAEDLAGSPATSNFLGAFIDFPSSEPVPPNLDIGIGEYGDRSDTHPAGVVSESVAFDGPDTHIYFRIRHQTTNRFNMEWSTDGIGWRQFNASHVPSWNPQEVVFAGYKTDGSSMLMIVDNFRVVSGSIARGDLYPGAKVLVDRGA